MKKILQFFLSLTSKHNEDVLSVQLLPEKNSTAQPNEGNTEHPSTRLTKEGCVFFCATKARKRFRLKI